ncbi:dimethylglycine dehydrogenase, mitochondrial-like [Diadema setosum]|uniref:dimethylglycine dehydrogenase, mitochondrial-like n=1 Tax=Diadema setosum TaxID=31175 RepID=UPI003B3B1D36
MGCLTRATTDDLKRRWNDKAETVIIGGGAVGASVAYNLAKAGMKDVVLLEKTELTAGATWHAPGMVSLYHPGINVKKIHYNSMKIYDQLEEETGQAIGFHKPGSIRLLQTPTRMDEARYQLGRQRWNDAYMAILTPEEVLDLCPIVNIDRVLGGLHTINDGHLDPYSMTQALAMGARRYGAKIYTQAEVTGLDAREDGTWDVATREGTIRAQRVVNVSGLWAKEVSQMVGVDLPMISVNHQYLVSSPMPEVAALKSEFPVIRDLESSGYCRMEGNGVVFGVYESQEKMKLIYDWAVHGVPKGFGRELFENDFDRVQEHLELLMKTFPLLASAEIQSAVSGPLTMSPDGLPLVGPSLGLRNYWSATPFGYGITHAGGIGHYLKDWIKNGEPPFDLIETDSDRYGKWCTLDYQRVKIPETYGMNNAVLYPKEERFGGRPTARISGAHKLMKERGAQYGFCAGWEQPQWFALEGDDASYRPSFYRTNWHDPVGREYETVTKRAGIIDLTPYAKFEVRGRDAHKLLDLIMANDVPTKVGDCSTGHMLTPNGRVYGEITVMKVAEADFFCITGAVSELHDLRWMDQKAWENQLDVQFVNLTDELGCLGIAGPSSRDILASITETDVSEEAFPFMTVQNVTVGGVKTRALRASYTGELGWELYHSRSETGALYKALLGAGEKYGVGDFGTFALNVLRMEKGFRAWGSEMTTDHNPIEAGLSSYIKLEKPFIGRDAVEKIIQRGPERHCVLLKVDADGMDTTGYESVWHEGKVVGHTTSGCFSYQLSRPIAFAYLPLGLQEVGSKVTVEILGNRWPAEVIPDPLMRVLADSG